MTKAEFARYVRRQVEELPAELQEVVGLQALGRRVWCWSHLTGAELDALCGKARTVSMLTVEAG